MADFLQNLGLKISIKMDDVTKAFSNAQQKAQAVFKKIETVKNAVASKNVDIKTNVVTDKIGINNVKKGLSSISALTVTANIATAPFKALSAAATTAFGIVRNAGIGTYAALGAAMYQFHSKFDESLKTYYEFDKQLGLIWTISDFGGSLDEQRKKLKDFGKEIHQIAINTASDISATARSAYWTISAGVQETFGYTREDVAKITEIGAKAATTSDSPNDTVTKALALMVNTYGEDLGKTAVERYERAADIMFKGQELGIMSVGDMATYQGKIIGMSKALGISPEDQAAYTIALSRGMNPAESFTAYSGMLSTIASPSQEAKRYADSIGLDFSVSNMRAMGLPAFLQKLYGIMGKDPDAEAKLFGNVRALRGLLNVFSEDSWKNYKIIANEFRSEKLHGSMERAHERFKSTDYFKKDEMETRHKIVQSKVGEAVAPSWLKMQQTGYSLLDYVTLEISKQFTSQEKLQEIVAESNNVLAGMGEKTKIWAGLLTEFVNLIINTGVVLNSVITNIYSFFQGMSSNWQLLNQQIAATFSSDLMANMFESAKNATTDFFNNVKYFSSDAFSFMASILNSIYPNISSIATSIISVFADIWDITKMIFTFLGRIVEKIFALQQYMGLSANIIKTVGNLLAIPLGVLGYIFNSVVIVLKKTLEWEERTRIVSSIFEFIGVAISKVFQLASAFTAKIVELARAVGLLKTEAAQISGDVAGSGGMAGGFSQASSIDSRIDATRNAAKKKFDDVKKIKQEIGKELAKGIGKDDIFAALVPKYGAHTVNRAFDQFFDEFDQTKKNVQELLSVGTNPNEINKTLSYTGANKSHVEIALAQLQQVKQTEHNIQTEVKESVAAVTEVKETAQKQQLILAREQAYKLEMQEKDHLSKMETYMKKDFARQTSLLKKEMDVSIDIIKKAKSAQEDIVKNLADSRISYVEKRAKIISAGLDRSGKDVQQRGIADFYQKKSEEAADTGKFDDAIKYAEKAQDIYAQLAEQQENKDKEYDLVAFDRAQKYIEDLFQSQKFANEKIIADSTTKIANLNNSLASIFNELQQQISIKVNTEDAKFKMQELQQKFVEVRKELGEYFSLAELKKDFSQGASGLFTKSTQEKISSFLALNKNMKNDYAYQDAEDVFSNTPQKNINELAKIETRNQPQTAEVLESQAEKMNEEKEARRKRLRAEAAARQAIRDEQEERREKELFEVQQKEGMQNWYKNGAIPGAIPAPPPINDKLTQDISKHLREIAQNTKQTAQNKQTPPITVRETKIDATIATQKLTQERK